MLPDRVSNPGPLTYESGALPIALRGQARRKGKIKVLKPHISQHFPCHRVASVANDWCITNKKKYLKGKSEGH